jgi:hypothetical protein
MTVKPGKADGVDWNLAIQEFPDFLGDFGAPNGQGEFRATTYQSHRFSMLIV